MFNCKQLETRIHAAFNEVYAKQHGDLEPKLLNDDTVLLETGLDSLGFAILITNLEEELGYDPFTESEEPYYPQTFAEFLEFYFKNQPQ